MRTAAGGRLLRVMTDVMAAHARAARPGLWERRSLRRLIANLPASLITDVSPRELF